jgi:DNA-binding transcriptional LysR family regulator
MPHPPTAPRTAVASTTSFTQVRATRMSASVAADIDLDDESDSSVTGAITLDSLGALNVFMRAAETRSFTNTGRQLSLSSSAVGKSVARLEERLGVRLFHRNTRCITLTQEGKSLLESCRRIFSEIRAVEQEFAQTKGAPKGKLRMSMPLVGMLMMPNMSKFMRAYPEIELDMDFTDSLVDVVDGGYDLVVHSGESSDSRLMSRRLGTYRLEIVGAPDYFARAGIPMRPDDLAVHACLHRKDPTTGKIQRWPFARPVSGRDFVLPTTATASTIDALISLAEQGVGIACVPDFSIRRQIAERSLVSVLGEHIEHTDALRVVWPSSRYLSPKLRVLIDFLAENLLPKADQPPRTSAFPVAHPPSNSTNIVPHPLSGLRVDGGRRNAGRAGG